MERKNVAIGLGAFDLDGKGRVVAPSDSTVQTVDQGIKLGGVEILKPSEVRDDPMADLPLLVAIALDQLQVLAPAGSRDLRVHVATLCLFPRFINMRIIHDVPQHDFRRNPALRTRKALVSLDSASTNLAQIHGELSKLGYPLA